MAPARTKQNSFILEQTEIEKTLFLFCAQSFKWIYDKQNGCLGVKENVLKNWFNGLNGRTLGYMLAAKGNSSDVLIGLPPWS